MIDLLARLVAIDSVNPALSPGAPGERAITNFVAGWLADHGVEVSEIPCDADADRPSLLCRVPGTGSGRSLMLYAHTDTVGVDDMDRPFAATVRDGALYGRGAWDMKGSLAGLMRVAANIAARQCPGDVWLMIVADEESDSRGTEAVLRELERRGIRPDGCIVTEPSGLRVMTAHRGFATGTIVTHGRAGHTAHRDEGADAIAMMARVIVALNDLDTRMSGEAGHPLLGHEAVVVSLIRGGSELFTYPAECRAQLVWRILPGRSRAALDAEVERIFAALKERDPHFDAVLTWQHWREPQFADAADITRAVAIAAHAELGEPPEVCG
ncbi:MAG: M20/M25/M40 family metallo-hydrolase, partial [Longimicrobiales bacterium]